MCGKSPLDFSGPLSSLSEGNLPISPKFSNMLARKQSPLLEKRTTFPISFATP